jgi:hypothetical protein
MAVIQTEAWRGANFSAGYLGTFYLDTDADVVDLPTNAAPGSTAFVIESGDTYILGSNGWVKL